MTKLRHRVEAFAGRVRWLGAFLGGPVPAALYLTRARQNPALRAEGRFPPFTFVFRATDLNAVREVLVDREYAFLRPVLGDLAAPLIIDAGAHIGLFALWVLSEKPASRILSIEADPQTFAVLGENIARSAASGTAWRAINRAAWSDSTRISFTDAGPAMSHRVSEAGEISVEGVRLAELIDMAAPAGDVDLLKVDIESAEEAFLCANPHALARVKNLVAELHPNLCNSDRVESLLKSVFSTVEAIGGRTSSKPLLLCRR